jgi:hypothetical protein
MSILQIRPWISFPRCKAMATAEQSRRSYSLSTNAAPELGFCPRLEVDEWGSHVICRT